MAGVDDVNSEKICLLSAILNDYKCDLACYIFSWLEYYVQKVGVGEGDTELIVIWGMVRMDLW